ncbi:hypothetical protein NC653_036012 [Populus alba x Populus x berolinensis]|uniref:Uncharacterized protein n=1 Tax=Populus alba x Populus x berolinensis TaxID=444605 RepID=A0AAD6LIT5_9ROSI|nr:hypothetical protein NC653_036012 [Populus alba x Populus x berolinensis]
MEKLTQEIKERKDAICSLSYNVPSFLYEKEIDGIMTRCLITTSET